MKMNFNKHHLGSLAHKSLSTSNAFVTKTNKLVTTIVSTLKHPVQFQLGMSVMATFRSQVLKNNKFNNMVNNILPMQRFAELHHMILPTLQMWVFVMGILISTTLIGIPLFLLLWNILEVLLIIIQKIIPPLDFKYHSFPLIAPHPSKIMMPGETNSDFTVNLLMTQRQQRHS